MNFGSRTSLYTTVLIDSCYRSRPNSTYEQQATTNLIKEERVLTETPVIGIITNPVPFAGYDTYVMGAYVRYVEQSGAKVVPIHHKASDEEICTQLEKINGVILQGGTTAIMTTDGELSFYGKKIKVIVEKAKELNARGIHFPIWAICLGFQALAAVEAPYKDTIAMNSFDSLDCCDKVKFVSEPSVSRMYKSIPEGLLLAMQNEEITYNNHHDGVYLSTFDKYSELKENYNVITTSTDRQGVEYVATFEHKQFPFYAHQYHPEKVQFVFREGLHIPR